MSHEMGNKVDAPLSFPSGFKTHSEGWDERSKNVISFNYDNMIACNIMDLEDGKKA